MDVAQFTAKERKHARKDLLKKIDDYNKQVRKSHSPGSFPITSPTKDLVFKGVVKIIYDRGYALQTKSLLLENTTTAAGAVEQLFDALGLRGSPSDYALEERNLTTGEIRMVGSKELPLILQLNHGPHQMYMEMRLVQVRDTRAPATGDHHHNHGGGGSDSDETISEEGGPNVVPKEEVIDHGVASVELIMEEALQDIPPLVHDIQERLKGLSESVAVDGKPRSGLPNRRLLWDILKPQASALVKDIRRLVDNGEFLANRHCSSPVVKLIATLLLELITDHSRELVSAIKQMCGLRGAAKTDFSSSVSLFTQQITYISKLVSRSNDALSAMAVSSHLLETTSPESLQNGRLTSESYFTGSGSVSGMLIFTVVSAYLGMVRAAYEDKQDFYPSLATNILRSSQRALEAIQKTEEYAMLHLHPLRSRVGDMELKLKVAMDNLIRGVKVAASSRPPPDAAPEMLQFGYALIMATLDFLMVAQCASLVHKVVVAGWEVMQFPWVRAVAVSGSEGKSDFTIPSAIADQLSSLGSDSTSGSSSYSNQRVEKAPTGERKSRIPACVRKESGDGTDAAELADREQPTSPMSFSQLGLKASQLRRPHYRDEIGHGFNEDDNFPPDSPLTPTRSEPGEFDSSVGGMDSESIRTASTATRVSRVKGQTPSSFDLETSQYMGIDAIKKLKAHYNINRAIAKGAESLLLTVTQKINVLEAACRNGSKDKYTFIVEVILGAAKQIQEEVSTMEMDLLVGQNMMDALEKSQPQMDSAIRDIELSTLMASSSVAPESAGMKLVAAIRHLQNICSKTVGDAWAAAGEHKKAVEQAEKMKEEFDMLMTGQKQDGREPGHRLDTFDRKKLTLPSKLAMTAESESSEILFEDTTAPPLSPGGRSWTTKEAPRVIGGTVTSLVQRLTYHRVIDSEFTETFMLTFHSFMPAADLMEALIARYNIEAPEDMSSWEEEAFEIEVAIPIRLRVIHALRSWLNYSYSDFKEEQLTRKLREFISTVQESMPSCAKQLGMLLSANLKHGPVHVRSVPPRGQAPTPLVPMNLSHGENFDLLDVNTLELSRQLSLAYSVLLKAIQPQELLSLGWRDEETKQSVPRVMKLLQMSKNLSELVCREILRESAEEDQSSVISYFIQTAQSCLDLKNYEAIFAIVQGLQDPRLRNLNCAWQMVTDHLMEVYDKLSEIVSPEINYHRYRQDIRIVHQSPCVPHLGLLLSEFEAIDKDHFDCFPDTEGIINFQKRRHFARIIQQLQRYQSSSYNLRPIEVIQVYLEKLKKPLSHSELDELSTKVDAFSI